MSRPPESASDEVVARQAAEIAALREQIEVLREGQGDTSDQSEGECRLVWRDRPDAAVAAANKRLAMLREQPDLAVGAGPAPHLFIEADNYDALLALAYTHAGRFDVIYIDPPYAMDAYGVSYEDDGWERSDWLSRITRRLRLARSLLAPGGLIFISISDGHQAYLTVAADQVFDEKNRLGPFIWFYEGVNDNQEEVKGTHEYILAYQVPRTNGSLNRETRDANVELPPDIANSVVKNGAKNPPSSITLPAGFPCQAADGVIERAKVKIENYSMDCDAVVVGGCLANDVVVTSGWSSPGILRQFINNQFQPVRDQKGQLTTFYMTASGNVFYEKARDQSYVISVLRNFGTVASASKGLADMGVWFPYPKPVGLIQFLISIHARKDALVLDFYAGSGTTGEAVLRQNAADNGTRRFVLVTKAEPERDGNKNPTGRIISRDVCLPRLRAVLGGYTHARFGSRIAGLGGSLRVFTVGGPDAEVDPALTYEQFCAGVYRKVEDALRIREDCYEEIARTRDFALFGSPTRLLAMLNVYSSRSDLLDAIEKVRDGREIRIYPNLPSAQPDVAWFADRLGGDVEVCRLPDEVINTYERLIRLPREGA